MGVDHSKVRYYYYIEIINLSKQIMFYATGRSSDVLYSDQLKGNITWVSPYHSPYHFPYWVSPFPLYKNAQGKGFNRIRSPQRLVSHRDGQSFLFSSFFSFSFSFLDIFWFREVTKKMGLYIKFQLCHSILNTYMQATAKIVQRSMVQL